VPRAEAQLVTVNNEEGAYKIFLATPMLAGAELN